MKERFEIYDGSAEAKKAKGKSKNLSGFHPLFTAAARRSIALDSLKIWLLLGFIVGVVTGVATGAGAVSVLLGLLIAAVIYFGFRDDVYGFRLIGQVWFSLSRANGHFVSCFVSGKKVQ